MSNDLTLSILLYADDVVLISETEDGVQSMLDSLRTGLIDGNLRSMSISPK